MQFQKLSKGHLYANILLKHHGHAQLYRHYRLGIECDHVFGSKWIANELFKPGFSIWYSEVNRFKKSVVGNQPMGNSAINSYSSLHTVWGSQGHFVKWGLSDIISLPRKFCFRRMWQNISRKSYDISSISK